MGDEQHGTLVFSKHLLQCFLTDDVHMVRGLIQDQKVGSGLEHFTQCKTHFLSAGELPHFLLHFFPGKQEAAQRALYFFPQIFRVIRPEILHDGLFGIHLFLYCLLLVKIGPFHILAELEFST